MIPGLRPDAIPAEERTPELEEILAGRGAQFDPDVCDAFLELSETFDQIRARLQEEATPGHALAHAAPAQQTQPVDDSSQGRT